MVWVRCKRCSHAIWKDARMREREVIFRCSKCNKMSGVFLREPRQHFQKVQ